MSRSYAMRCAWMKVIVANAASVTNAAVDAATASLCRPDELARAIQPGVLRGEHRLAAEMSLQVRCQLFGGAVASLGVLAHRHADDAVDFAAQEFLQPRRRRRTARDDVGQQLGRFTRGARDHLAGRRRFLLADDALHLQQARAEQLEWPPSAQQLVEQHAEHVDVAGGRDHVAAHLLRARVCGRHDAVLGVRDRERRRRLARVEELGDAEIQ